MRGVFNCNVENKVTALALSFGEARPDDSRTGGWAETNKILLKNRGKQNPSRENPLKAGKKLWCRKKFHTSEKPP